MKRLCTGILLAAVAAAAHAGAFSPLVIRVGEPEWKPSLRFGWSSAELGEDGRFRWMNRLEADVLFPLEAAQDVRAVIRAAPLYLSWRRQVIGLYVNRRFVREWTCPDDPAYHDYEALIPAGLLIPGTNTLTLRAGYRKRVPPDKRELSLAVSTITLTTPAGERGPR